MRALLLVAHGSRRAESNDEVHALAALLRQRAAQRYTEVGAAFLELAEPSIPDAIDACIGRGAREVVVLPYFLSRGRHVVTDIPAQVEPKRAQHPHVTITIAPYLGAAEAVVDVLLQLAD